MRDFVDKNVAGWQLPFRKHFSEEVVQFLRQGSCTFGYNNSRELRALFGGGADLQMLSNDIISLVKLDIRCC